MAAAGGNHLSSGRVNVGLLRECARRELLQCLNKQPGSKVTHAFLYLHVTCAVLHISFSVWSACMESSIMMEKKTKKIQTSFCFIVLFLPSLFLS